MNFYNDNDRKACAWLRELIADGLIPPGVVDNRSILEIKPDDLKAYTQCHFFAGISGWSLALDLARWSPSRPVWTGSCPCQPFSAAGKRKGVRDHRDLWPAFRDLIAVCKPPTVFGEQVASADGRTWLAGVRADLEELGYAVGAADLCAAGVGAPHIRQRLWWVADRSGELQHGGPRQPAGEVNEERDEHGGGGPPDRLPDAEHDGRGPDQPGREADRGATTGRSGAGTWGDTWLPCSGGKARRVEPGTPPLAHGLPRSMADLRARMGELGGDAAGALRDARRYRRGSLMGYGNSIVPQVAAEFIRAYMDTKED